MIYLRKNLMEEDGILELGIYDDELVTYCSECAKKHKEPEEQKTTFKDILEGGALSGMDAKGKVVYMIIETDGLIHKHLKEEETTNVLVELNEALRALYKELKGA